MAKQGNTINVSTPEFAAKFFRAPVFDEKSQTRLGAQLARADDVELGAGCDVRALSVVGPGARIGERNMLDHGIRVAAGEAIAAEALRFS